MLQKVDFTCMIMFLREKMTKFFSNESLLLSCMNRESVLARQYHSPPFRSVQSFTLRSQGVSPSLTLRTPGSVQSLTLQTQGVRRVRLSLLTQGVFRVSLCAFKECSESHSEHSRSVQSLTLRTQGVFRVSLCTLK